MAAKNSASVKARQELESLRVNAEQEERIIELEEEVRLLRSHAASSQPQEDMAPENISTVEAQDCLGHGHTGTSESNAGAHGMLIATSQDQTIQEEQDLTALIPPQI